MTGIFKGIKFDDFVDNRNEYNSFYVCMCESCVNKHRNLLGNRLDDVGQGICSVIGCENDADYYVDFDENEFQIMEV